MTLKATIGSFDPHVAFEQPADFERAEINGPDPIVNLFQTDMLADAGDRDMTRSQFQRMPPLALTGLKRYLCVWTVPVACETTGDAGKEGKSGGGRGRDLKSWKEGR